MRKASHTIYEQLPALFFETRQIIRSELPSQAPGDANMWLRCEILRFIDGAENPTMHDIAAYARIKAPSATSLVAHLKSRGFVLHEKSPEDKRTVRIRLTSKGRTYLDSYRERSVKNMHRVFSHLNAHEIEMLARVLSKVRNAHRPE